MVELIEDVIAFSDGRQNAWSGLAAFRGRYYLAFRNARYHTQVRSNILLVSSADGRAWSEPTGFPSLDFRLYWHDNCQMYVYHDRLFIRIASIFPAPVGPQLVGQVTIYSDDGEWWSEPDVSVPIGYLNWGTAEYDGILYGAFTPRNSMGVGVFAKSDDGLQWKTIAALPTIGYGLAITPDGEAFISGYTRTPGKHGVSDRLLRARPPYEKWEESELGAEVHAPMLKVINGRVLLAGRINHEKHMRYEFGPQTAVFAFDGDRFVEQFRLPETYDCGYNGIAPSLDRPDEALISDYRGLRVGLPPNRWYPGLEEKRGDMLFSRYEGNAISARADIHALRVRVR